MTFTASPTPTDSGPADAVTAAFHTAQAGGLSSQLDFLACVVGGADAIEFSSLFGGLAELALATSGVDAEEFWAAFGNSFDEFSAVELSRSGNRAVVNVKMKLTITPDVAELREMMRAGAEQHGDAIDDATINAIIDRLIGRMELEQVVENDLTVVRVDGSWQARPPEVAT